MSNICFTTVFEHPTALTHISKVQMSLSPQACGGQLYLYICLINIGRGLGTLHKIYQIDFLTWIRTLPILGSSRFQSLLESNSYSPGDFIFPRCLRLVPDFINRGVYFLPLFGRWRFMGPSLFERCRVFLAVCLSQFFSGLFLEIFLW